MSITAPRPPLRHLHLPQMAWLDGRKALLGCGIVATALYIAGDALAATAYDGYSYRDQTISELSAIGADTRRLWIPIGYGYAALIIAFALGVWQSAAGNRKLLLVAALAGVLGVVGLAAWPFAPMHQREVLAAGGGDWHDTMHIALSVVDMLIFFGSVTLGVLALGRGFRIYSAVTLGVVLAFGVLTSLSSPGVQDNGSTPWLGINERIMLFGSMQWYAGLAVALWGHAHGGQANGAIRPASRATNTRH